MMLRRGDMVVVRSASEIRATLDQTGCLEGVPFMPEMLKYVGGRFTVASRVERGCDTAQQKGVRRLPGTVVLTGLRCDGGAHGGCQAACLIYWKEAWLSRVDREQGAVSHRDADSQASLESLIEPNATLPGGEVKRYRCQATEFVSASQPLDWWDVRSFARELATRNRSVWRFAVVCVQIVIEEVRRRTGTWAEPVKPAGEKAPDPPRLGLKPGDIVRVRSKDEIERTLDGRGKTRGLWFDREMLPYCDQTHEVTRKVERFVDERTGEMVILKSDCLILKDVVCGGLCSYGRWFCPRAIYPWWREDWLDPLSRTGATTDFEVSTSD
jgi:hypothetical protein